jgi:beta-aspartyl-peptidase (threonine type)
VIKVDLAPHKVGAGAIAIDAHGSMAAPYNTDGMFRGWITVDGNMAVATHDQVYFLGEVAGTADGVEQVEV